jgi:hypothetical protein
LSTFSTRDFRDSSTLPLISSEDSSVFWKKFCEKEEKRRVCPTGEGNFS